MGIPTKELVYDPQPEAVQQVEPVSMFERLAANPSVDVDKLERMMAMKERAELRVAEGFFNTAMSAAQKAMRPIAADATNPQTRSKYATYAALDSKLRPIYTEHGFGMSFDEGDCPRPEWKRVLAYVTHSGGFARTYHIDMPADGKGAKGGDVMTLTHAVGAAMSYGMRYLLKMIWNVAVGEDDRDGNDPAERHETPTPAGFESWWTDMCATADTGMPALEAAWKASKPQFKAYVDRSKRKDWQDLKTRAGRVTA